VLNLLLHPMQTVQQRLLLSCKTQLHGTCCYLATSAHRCHSCTTATAVDVYGVATMEFAVLQAVDALQSLLQHMQAAISLLTCLACCLLQQLPWTARCPVSQHLQLWQQLRLQPQRQLQPLLLLSQQHCLLHDPPAPQLLLLSVLVGIAQRLAVQLLVLTAVQAPAHLQAQQQQMIGSVSTREQMCAAACH
jgi:hypothetical protein